MVSPEWWRARVNATESGVSADNQSMMNTMPTKEQVIVRLAAVPIFSGTSVEDLETLSGLVQYRRFPRGALVVGQNEHGTAMFLLISGRVKISLASPEGKELVLNYLEAPTHFGEMSLVDNEPRSADAIAVTDVELLSIDADDLSAVIQVQPRLALSLIATLSHRLRQTNGRLEDMAFHDATHRVMRVVLNVATAGLETRGVPIIQGMTHYDIATLAGTSRETASRVVSSLARRGIVKTSGRQIIVDLVRLSEDLERE
jgi:CRP/FNR family transcriptional regulator, cyclic AMP receptor protein